jgi:ubiquinone/menaquinone biosynthesis C-methylase UbiE
MIDALHLVGLGELLREVSRVLQKDGRFVVYTRTKEQNDASLLGRLFPSFADVETRLLHSRDLYTSLSEQPGLELIEWRSVEHSRRKAVAELIHEIRGLPYSTFALYKPSELQVALEQFCQRVRDRGEDDLRWTEGNTVVVLRRF